MSRSRAKPPEAWRPTRDQIAAAEGAGVSDVLAGDLAVLFCGINPGLYSGAVGHHFARPGNRFWKTLRAAGFTERQLTPFEERELLEYGLGITNLVNRATATANKIGSEELRAGAKRMQRKVRRWSPRWVAFLGLGAYRSAFGSPDAVAGRQEERLADAGIWLLPNPSGLNAHYQLDDLASTFAHLREAVERTM